jgi:hypothetical protein
MIFQHFLVDTYLCNLKGEGKMTLRAQKSGLRKLVSNNGISIWSYHCTNHILDVMIKPRFFARLSDPFEPGDIILVDCPGYYEILRFLGYPPRPVHRPGGGVLQVETKQESGRMTVRIVGRGLRRFVNAGENAIPGFFGPESASMSPQVPEPDIPAEADQNGAMIA